MANSLIFLLFIFLFLNEAFAADWVVGYGSLMSSSYFPVGKDKSYPVRISGMTRAWDSPGTFALGQGAGLINLAFQENTIFLGAYESNGTLNGVAHTVDASELAALDLRQTASGVYVRSQLPLTRVTVLYGEQQFQENDNIWIYLLNSSYASMLSGPSSSALITQSYLDIVLSACLVIDQKYADSMGVYSFSQEFMNTTLGWDVNYWVNDRVLPRRPWTYQSNVAQIDKILLDYFGSSTLAKIELDDPNANYTNLRLMVQYGNDIAALKLNDTVFRTELDWHAGNISDLRASTSSEFTRVNSELGYLNANLSEHKINTTAQFKRINEDFASHVANYDQFKASTSTEFTQVKNAQAQMRADITVMSVEMDRMKERIRVMEEDYKVLLITWIVSIIVFALILVGIIFFLWKKNQQPESFESIPLRPARGYSYT